MGDFSTTSFRIHRYKIRMCGRTEQHDENECPFAHAHHDPGRRRDHNRRYYSYERCPHFSEVGACPDRDACLFAHGDNEVWFHPLFYRTRRCSDAPVCTTRFCPFVHTDEEDRTAEVQREQRGHRRRLWRLSNQEQQFSNQPRSANTSAQGSSSSVSNRNQRPNYSQTPMIVRREETPPRPRLDPIARPTRANIGVHVHQQQEPQSSVLAPFPTDLSRAIPPLQADAAPLKEARSKRKHNSEAGSSNN
ncbi:hypothetical protein C2S52_005087 [Perilla frutescens var. hirtella]|nr:hypothetical protein C2S52_005087 [Perilla frutescens var. hirtella]